MLTEAHITQWEYREEKSFTSQNRERAGVELGLELKPTPFSGVEQQSVNLVHTKVAPPTSNNEA